MSGLQRADPLFLEQLLGMGFPEARATRALMKTHNCGVEPALNWLLEHMGDPDIDEPWVSTQVPGVALASGSEAGGAIGSAGFAAGPSSQCAPAAVGAVQWGSVAEAGGGGGLVLGLPSDAPVVVQPDGRQAQATVDRFSAECKVVLVVALELGMSAGKVAAQCAHAALGMYRGMAAARATWLRAWEEQGEKTVVLSAGSCADLEHLEQRAQDLGLQTHMVYDAGRTEVPGGSNTVLAVGGVAEEVDRVTGSLRTLR